MVLMVQKLSKLYHKLENHHHHHRAEVDVLSASLQAFRSDVSNCLNQLLSSNPNPGSEILSFPWIQQCFELLPLINKAFLKLVKHIDYPMTSWEAASLDQYLNYGLHVLELLNSASSSLSRLSQARLSFAHGLTLVDNSPSTAIEHLKAIQPQSSSLIKGLLDKEDREEKFGSCKERIVNEAMVELKSIGFWVFGVVLASLSGETKPYLEMKQVIAGFNTALLIDVIDSCVFDVIVEKGETLKEVKELNDAANCLVSAIVAGETSDAAAMDMEGKLGDFEKQMEVLEKQVDVLFSKVLATRNEVLHCVRQRKQ